MDAPAEHVMARVLCDERKLQGYISSSSRGSSHRQSVMWWGWKLPKCILSNSSKKIILCKVGLGSSFLNPYYPTRRMIVQERYLLKESIGFNQEQLLRSWTKSHVSDWIWITPGVNRGYRHFLDFEPRRGDINPDSIAQKALPLIWGFNRTAKIIYTPFPPEISGFPQGGRGL